MCSFLQPSFSSSITNFFVNTTISGPPFFVLLFLLFLITIGNEKMKNLVAEMRYSIAEKSLKSHGNSQTGRNWRKSLRFTQGMFYILAFSTEMISFLLMMIMMTFNMLIVFSIIFGKIVAGNIKDECH